MSVGKGLRHDGGRQWQTRGTNGKEGKFQRYTSPPAVEGDEETPSQNLKGKKGKANLATSTLHKNGDDVGGRMADKVGCAIGEWERHGHGKKTYRRSAARGRKGGMSALDWAWFVGLLSKFSLTCLLTLTVIFLPFA